MNCERKCLWTGRNKNMLSYIMDNFNPFPSSILSYALKVPEIYEKCLGLILSEGKIPYLHFLAGESGQLHRRLK